MNDRFHVAADLRCWIALAAMLALPAAAFAQGTETSLKGRADVLLAETFETVDWFKRWGRKELPQNFQVAPEKAADGKPNAVAKVLFKKGDNWGSEWSLSIQPSLDEAYLRYYVKWEAGFDFGQGGKTPGLMGWAPGKQAGWGGRTVHGDDGFSSRVCWGRRGSLVMYTYHADMKGQYGDGFRTSIDGRRESLRAGRWYCFELHMKLNTPGAKPGEKGKNDGLVELWVDGALVGRQDGLRFRDIPTLKIDNLFVNAYFGGSWTSPKDQYIFYDNIVLATKPIGPIGAKPPDDKPEGGKSGGKFSPPPGWEK